MDNRYVRKDSFKQKKEELKYSLLYSAGLILFLIITGFFIFFIAHDHSHEVLFNKEFQELSDMEERIHDIFSRIEVSLVHTTLIASVWNILISENQEDRINTEYFLSGVIDVSVNRFSPAFDQARLLDLSGMEIIRVNLIDGLSQVSPISELQDKSSRYYYTESIGMNRNQVFMSPFDLNMEHGEIETPLKPMIRFVVNVFSPDGEKRGLFILNYLAQQVISDINSLNSNSKDSWYLINQDGYYLHGPKPENDFAFMYPDKLNNTVEKLDPELWEILKQGKEGKVEFSNGFYLIRNIIPSMEGSEYSTVVSRKWTLIKYIPGRNFYEEDRKLILLIFLGIGIVSPLLIYMGWMFGKIRIKKKWAQEALERNATTDGMTGLLNHSTVLEKLSYLINISKRMDTLLSIVYLDLNDLKMVNDKLGHEYGDAIIIAAAAAINESIRDTDIPARIGGDEFLILFPGTSPVQLLPVLTRIKEIYEKNCEDIVSGKASFSWGSAEWEGPADNQIELIARADKAMYGMKKLKKNNKQQS